MIADMRVVTDIGWLRIHSAPFRDALLTIVTTWIKKYTNFLFDNMAKEIENIQNFIDDVTKGIKVIPEQASTKKEKEILMQVMTHLRDVKMIKDHTANEFEPMKDTVVLLKKHGEITPQPDKEDYLVIIERMKSKLKEVSQQALGPVKEEILPLQNQEASNIKQRLSDFSKKVEKFRQEFQTNCPYHIEDSSPEIIDQAYQTIGIYYDKAIDLEKEAGELNNLETLFDLQKTTYKQLRECKNELVQLKYMWDLISLVDYQFNAWKQTLWDKIDVDLLTQLIKEMQSKLTNPQNIQNKEIKSWKAFNAVNDRVRNMNTILPLIAQLHSKHMQVRHWRKLEVITQKTIKFDSPNFCMEDLIQLQLYKYAEDVTELVDSATKEAKIESKLNAIEKIWEEEKFEFIPYGDTFEFGLLDEIIEYVDNHSMEI